MRICSMDSNWCAHVWVRVSKNKNYKSWERIIIIFSFRLSLDLCVRARVFVFLFFLFFHFFYHSRFKFCAEYKMPILGFRFARTRFPFLYFAFYYFSFSFRFSAAAHSWPLKWFRAPLYLHTYTHTCAYLIQQTVAKVFSWKYFDMGKEKRSDLCCTQ